MTFTFNIAKLILNCSQICDWSIKKNILLKQHPKMMSMCLQLSYKDHGDVIELSSFDLLKTNSGYGNTADFQWIYGESTRELFPSEKRHFVLRKNVYQIERKRVKYSWQRSVLQTSSSQTSSSQTSPTSLVWLFTSLINSWWTSRLPLNKYFCIISGMLTYQGYKL